MMEYMWSDVMNGHGLKKFTRLPFYEEWVANLTSSKNQFLF